MKRLLALSLLAALVAAPMSLAQQPSGKVSAQPSKPQAAQPAKEDKAADKSKPADKKMDEKSKAAAADEMSKPGPSHKMLAALEGEWQAEVKDLTPGAEATDKGTMTCKMVYGGRFLSMDFDGRYHGKFFKGGGLWGYNNAQKRFECSWADSSDTALMFMTGSSTNDGKAFNMTGECTDPATGKPCTMKEVTTISDKAHWHTDFFVMNAGKEMKIMEIDYTKGAKEDKPAMKDDKAPAKTPTDKAAPAKPTGK